MERRDGARDRGVCRTEWGARSACGEAAGSVARMSVTRGDAYGLGPTRAGIPRGSKHDPGDYANGCTFLAAPGYITRNADEHEKPVSDQAGNVGMLTRDREDITGRAAAGRAGSFNPEEQRSSRFLSYGPPLREERLRSFCPPGGGLAHVAQRGCACGGRERGEHRATRTR